MVKRLANLLRPASKLSPPDDRFVLNRATHPILFSCVSSTDRFAGILHSRGHGPGRGLNGCPDGVHHCRSLRVDQRGHGELRNLSRHQRCPRGTGERRCGGCVTQGSFPRSLDAGRPAFHLCGALPTVLEVQYSIDRVFPGTKAVRRSRPICALACRVFFRAPFCRW